MRTFNIREFTKDMKTMADLWAAIKNNPEGCTKSTYTIYRKLKRKHQRKMQDLLELMVYAGMVQAEIDPTQMECEVEFREFTDVLNNGAFVLIDSEFAMGKSKEDRTAKPGKWVFIPDE